MRREGSIKPTPLLDQSVSRSVSQSVSQSVSLQTSRKSPPPLILRGNIVAREGRGHRVRGGLAMAQAGCALLPGAPSPGADPRFSPFQNP